jgi:hypothetical protein
MNNPKLDESIKFFMKHFYNFNTDLCNEIIQPFSELEVISGVERIDFSEFLKRNISSIPIAGEYFSTKDRLDQVIKKNSSFEVFKNKYFERTKMFYFIMHTQNSDSKQTKVGILENLQIYNGFPVSIKSSELEANPEDIFRNIMNSPEKVHIMDAFSAPETYTRQRAFLLPDFRRDYVVDKKSKQN